MARKMTREQWLNAFMRAARPHFKRVGAPVPEKVRVSVGFTSKGAKTSRIGECWHDSHSVDGTFEIFIVPSMGDGPRIADILTHELVHTAVGFEAGHGPIFRRVATALGLEGRMTATVAGEAWFDWAQPILDCLGPIPHASLMPTAIGGGSSGPQTPDAPRKPRAPRRDKMFVLRRGDMILGVVNSAKRAVQEVLALAESPPSTEVLAQSIQELRDEDRTSILDVLVEAYVVNSVKA